MLKARHMKRRLFAVAHDAVVSWIYGRFFYYFIAPAISITTPVSLIHDG